MGDHRSMHACEMPALWAETSGIAYGVKQRSRGAETHAERRTAAAIATLAKDDPDRARIGIERHADAGSGSAEGACMMIVTGKLASAAGCAQARVDEDSGRGPPIRGLHA
jgi:hypothetical protein